MADLSATQTPSLEDLLAGVGDLSAPETYIPPRSGTFRTSRFPGFFGSATGATPSNNPNPVAGDNAVALPPTGVDPNAAASSAPSGLFSVTNTDPSAQSTTTGERTANRIKEVGDAGVVTDPADALRAVSLGLSLTSPTGIAGLAATTAANLLGAPDEATDPVGALLEKPNGNPWDLKSNINKRPGYSDEYNAGIKRGLSPQASLNAAQSATEPGANTWGKSYGTQPRDPSGAAPAAPARDVTAANAQTGFGGQGATGTPSPTSLTSGIAAKPSPGQAGFNANGGNGSNNGGRGGVGSGKGPAGASRGYGGGHGVGGQGFAKGGVVTEHHKKTMKSNHDTLKQVAAKAGMTVPALIAKVKNADSEIGKRAKLEAHVMQLACGGKVKKYADGGIVAQGNGSPRARRQQTSPYSHPELAAGATPPTPWIDPDSMEGQTAAVGKAQREAWLASQKPQKKAMGGMITGEGVPPAESDQYNPPAEQTAGEGDIVPAMLTPGELVVTKPAASQYSPDVSAAINDPQMAAQINDLIEQFLSGEGGDDGDGMDSEDSADMAEDESEDGSGLGVMSQMRGVPLPKSKLSNITRVA